MARGKVGTLLVAVDDNKEQGQGSLMAGWWWKACWSLLMAVKGGGKFLMAGIINIQLLEGLTYPGIRDIGRFTGRANAGVEK